MKEADKKKEILQKMINQQPMSLAKKPISYQNKISQLYLQGNNMGQDLKKEKQEMFKPLSRQMERGDRDRLCPSANGNSRRPSALKKTSQTKKRVEGEQMKKLVSQLKEIPCRQT